MRERVIGQPVGNRSSIAAKRSPGAIEQRPARRRRHGWGEALGARMPEISRYLPVMAKAVLAVVVGALVFAGYRAAASASLFQVRRVDVQGTARASTEEIQTLVRHEASKAGVWQADLTALSARIERVPWVRTAVVSRVLPDGLRVRITERVPRVVVRISSGHFVWVDDDAVLLGEMSPADQISAFFLRGWAEEDSEQARSENRERVQKYLELAREWDAAKLSDRVSEVNLIDLRDVRVQLAGDDSQIEVRLGSQELGKRLKQALEVLDEQRQTLRGPLISYVDLSRGKRAIVGFTSGRQASDNQNAGGKSTEKPGSGNRPEKRPARVGDAGARRKG